MDLIEVLNDTREMSKTRYAQATYNMHTKVCDYASGQVDFYKNKNLAKAKNRTIPRAKFISGGTVNSAYRWADDYHVALLNFAHPTIPGGFVLDGAQAQEESICRCSTLYEALISMNPRLSFYEHNEKHLNDNIFSDRVMYTEDVAIFKDDITYLPKEPRYVDVITCPAPLKKMSKEQAKKVFEKRFTNIVCSAVEHNADTLLLGAWGCGAFGQNPHIVAEVMANVLNEWGYNFKHIIFSFKESPNSYVKCSEIFCEEFENNYIGGVLNWLN